jgi:putative ATP-dependent endonuclease of the OLD family
MRLSKIFLHNYRCYKEITEIILNDLTCFIGKNDIGKSTILEAFNSFFNDSIDKGDLSVDSSSDTIEITCIFENLPSKIILDTSVETTLAEEYLLNKDGHLEIKRAYKFGKTISKSTYIIANHPNDKYLRDLLNLKNTPLKALADQIGANLEGVDKKHNPPLRKAIRNKIGINLELMEIKVDGTIDNESNIKLIWKNIMKILPIYSLFKVDKTLDDKDKDVQDPMKLAIKESLAIPEIKTLLDQIEEAIKENSTKMADETLKKLKKIDRNLAEKMKSDFNKDPAWDKIFDLTLLGENNIPLNKRGSGIRRLVLLSFFQAQAEKRKAEENAPSIIYGIEEPETSQHPDFQMLLIKSLEDLSQTNNTQVFFTSHSANLVREIPMESLRYIYKDIKGLLKIDSGCKAKTNELDEGTINKIIETLGILPNPKDKVKVLLYVEGNHDVCALSIYSAIINAHDNGILCLTKTDAIGIVIAGGSALKFYINNKYLSGLGKPEVHIYDNDVEEYRTTVMKINSENIPTKKAYNTLKLELENYLHEDAIMEAYKANGTNISLPKITDKMDVPLIVAKAIYEAATSCCWDELKDDKKKKDKISHAKSMLNTQAVEKMTVARIKERNAYEEIVKWLDCIKSMCN